MSRIQPEPAELRYNDYTATRIVPDIPNYRAGGTVYDRSIFPRSI